MTTARLRKEAVKQAIETARMRKKDLSQQQQQQQQQQQRNTTKQNISTHWHVLFVCVSLRRVTDRAANHLSLFHLASSVVVARSSRSICYLQL